MFGQAGSNSFRRIMTPHSDGCTGCRLRMMPMATRRRPDRARTF